MAGDRGRAPRRTEPTLQDQEKPDSNQRGSEPDSQSRQAVAGSKEMEGAVVLTDRVRFDINTRKARIDPSKKRAAFVRRLEKVMRQCDRIMANPEGVEDIQVKAMGTLIRAIQVCYGLIVDVEVEELEREIGSLEEEETRLVSGEEETGRGYSIKEDSAE